MATALAAQLAQLSAAKPGQEKYVRGKASLLFDYQKAADVSVEQLLNIAQSALATLIQSDKRFKPFADSLFNRSSVHASREQLTTQENDALNATIAAFLRVLTNSFLAAPAFQVLEYCIRRYKVHVYNVNELLLCALPYHAAPEFARLLVLLQLKGTPWEWLTPGQQSGAPPPRDIFVRRCVNDHAVLRLVCQGAQAVGVPGFVSKTFLSLYAVLVCEVLAALPRVTEDLLTLLLPFLAAGLKADASREYSSATLMILTQLLVRAQLSADFLKVVMLDVVRGWSELGGSTVLMMLAHLATTQPQCSAVPLKALQVLAQEHTHVAQELSSLQARQANLAPLLQLLLPSTIQALPGNPGLEPLASALLQQVSISPQLVQAAAVKLLEAGAAAAGQQQKQQHLQRVLRVCDVHFPEELDAAINTTLQQAAATAAADTAADAAAGSSSSKAKKHKAGKGQKPAAGSADAMFDFIQTCFAGSRHEVVSAADPQQQQQQQQAFTLSLAVHAPASEMRILALQKLDAVASAAGSDDGAVPEATQQLLQSSLLSGLRDDVFAVAAAAASAQGLAAVPGQQQLPALQYLLQRAATVCAAGHVVPADTASAAGGGPAENAATTGGAKEALQAAKAALAAVGAAAAAGAGDVAEAEATALQQQATALLLEFVLADKRSKRLAKTALKVALQSSSWSPLLAVFAASPAVAAAVEGAVAADPAADTDPSPDGKRRQKGSKAAASAAADADAGDAGKHSGALVLNRAVVAALAEAVAADAAAGGEGLLAQVSSLLLLAGPRCRQLLLLVLVNAAAAAAAVPATPVGKAASPASKKAKGKSTAAAPASEPSGSSSIAAVLVRALEQQLEAAAAAAAAGAAKAGQAVAALPGNWAEESEQLLDAAHLPTKAHLQLLPTQLTHLNAVLLLTALHEALSRAPAAALTHALGQPVQLFARLAAAAAAADAHSGFGLLQHLQLIVSKSGETSEQQLEFVSSVYGLPAAVAGEAVQAVALQLLPGLLSSDGRSSSSSSAWFLRMLAAANSSNKRVRRAAMDAVCALAGSIGQGDGVAAALLPAEAQDLVVWLQQNEQLPRASAGALQRLLCAAVAGDDTAMEVDGDSGASRSRKASKAAAAKSKAAAVPHEGAVSPLGADAAAAVLQLLQQSLPQLSSDADLSAAQLAVAVLAAAPEQAAAAEPAQQLQQQLLAKLLQRAGAVSSSDKRTVWYQLVSAGPAVAAAGVAAAVAAAAEQLQQLCTGIAASLLQFYTPQALQQQPAVAESLVQLMQAPFAAAAAAGFSNSGSSLSAAQLAAMAAVRVAAFQQLTPEAFAALTQRQQQASFTAALQTLASDGSADCRAAARQCLQELHVTADMLLQQLQAVTSSAQATAAEAPPTQSKAKRARKGIYSAAQEQQQQKGAAGPEGVSAAALDAAVAALEFMQWRDDIPDRQQLLQPLQDLLRLLVPFMGSIADRHIEQEDAEGAVAAAAAAGLATGMAALSTDNQAAEQPTAGAEGAVSASAAGYASQLVLLVLQQLVREQLAHKAAGIASGSSGSSVDVDLVLSCASAAPDGAVRNAALLLLAALGELSPEDVLEHVLKALAVIQHSAALQADAHSQAVASTTLTALVPAWLAAGRGSEELWGSLLEALPGLPAHRRLGLLEALLAALPEDKGLAVGLLLMMQRVELSTAKRAAAAATAAAATAASPGKGKKGQKGKAAAPPPQQPEAPPADPAEDQELWLPELMASLCEKVAVQPRLAALAAVLSFSLTDSQGQVAAHEPLPRFAVSFVTVNLKAKSVASAIAAAKTAAQAGSPDAQVSLQQSCQAIMTQALQHLLHLNPSEAAAAANAQGNDAQAAARVRKAISTAAAGVYSLLAALEAVQDCPSYLLALVQMSKQSADAVQRRSLKLLADRLSKAQLDLADLEASTSTLPAAARQAAEQELAEAGLAVCAELPRLLGPDSPAVTKQLALIAADAGMRLFGKLLPAVVLASMLEVLQVVQDASAPVRASALTCIASGVTVLGVQLVPLLPKTATAVLAAAEAAAQELSDLQQQQQQQQQADSDSGSDTESDSGSDSDADQEQEEEVSAAALQLAGAVTALEALVVHVGGFMSPYLPRVLQLLLHQQVLQCTVAGANAVAGRLRVALPAKVPSRLLLPPLLQQWEGALAACSGAGGVDAAPAVALLDLVTGLCSSLQPAEAVNWHEQLAGLLLSALGTRSRWLAAAAAAVGEQQQQPSAAAASAAAADVAAAAAASIAGLSAQGVFSIEAAAVRALAALTMKLSESRFKPMFLRLLDWTNAAAAESQEAVGRVAALFAAVCTFSERLRSVFAPYYKYFLALLMQQLAGWGLSGGHKRSKKKRKLSAAAAGDAAAGGSSSEAVLLSAWLARLRAVRAVHLLALHEGTHDSPAAQQEQQERFDKLMPLLVEVLQEGVPAAVAAELAVQGADSALDLPGGPVAALGAVGAAVVEAGAGSAVQQHCDVVGTAAVGALVQLAVAGGSDVVWKPLHHALLLATRGGSTRAKLLALGGVSRLAELLREDYLNLLPEALGFIAELVEDGELAVEAAAQGLLAQLEALSGEKLEQYLKAS